MFAVPKNLLFFLASVIFDVLTLSLLDFYPFLFNVYFEYIYVTGRIFLQRARLVTLTDWMLGRAS